MFKKIRNNIKKSGDQDFHTLKLCCKGKTIVWKHWMDAHRFNSNRDINPIAIHRKLTEAHISPNQSELMRNHLAEDVLDTEMLHLMKVS